MKNLRLVAGLVFLFSQDLFAVTGEAIAENNYSSGSEKALPTNVYWGDTHVHTDISLDAFIGGWGRPPEDAYRFAKGESVKANNGVDVTISRPLDFLVIADHAANFGVMKGLAEGDSRLLSTSLGQSWASTLKKLFATGESDPEKAVELSGKLFYGGMLEAEVGSVPFRESTWQSLTELADKHNDPGKFTALIGYEWTSLVYYLHRVVIFKDDASIVGQVLPFSQLDSRDPEKLWAHLNNYEATTGGEVLAIPHNGNMSRGVMFALETVDGKPLSSDYAKTRNRWEPLMEVTQLKGDSEAHPSVSPTDVFADYETFSYGAPVEGSPSEEMKKKLSVIHKKDYIHYDSWVNKNNAGNEPEWMYQYEYARPGLKLGLQQQAKLGANPFKFGMIGSTDSHTGISAADENNFWLKPSDEKAKVLVTAEEYYGSNNAAGYAAVWSEENTRESLFAAMKRKEVYASTGPRMTVRFFGGWDYQNEDAFSPDLAKIGYEKGVPMGGDLSNSPKSKAPQFLIRAVKDPDGANLDRVQVIKGWHDANGELHEKIYHVALSDNRKPNWRGKV